ncbi:MAG: HAD-IA family hydrolase [Bacteroidales bacterium]|nr:HAD-IA family hydrolase [Bacteroidales bacterium]
MPQGRLKAAVFDFNGTLFWDTPYHNRAFRILAERYSVPSSEGLRSRRMEDGDLAYIQGRTNNFIMAYMFGEGLTDAQIADLGEEKEQIYRDLCHGEVRFAPGAEELFVKLSEAGVRMAIASSADINNVNFYYTEISSLESWFPRERFIYNDWTFNSKPAPDIFLKAFAALGVRPDEAAVFEDSPAGIKASESAGSALTIVIDSQFKPADLDPSHPVITDFRQAIPLLIENA